METVFINLKIKNCYVFNEQVELSLRADMRTKKFPANVFNSNNVNVLKSVGIYGPNNTGKTCIVKIFEAIRSIIYNNKPDLMPNIFNNNNICEIGFSFLDTDRVFNYEFKYDVINHEYVYEKFSELTTDTYGNEKEHLYFERDFIKSRFSSKNPDLEKVIGYAAKGNILVNALGSESFSLLKEVNERLRRLADKIEILYMTDIDRRMKKTINLLMDENQKNEIVEFIRNADLYLDDIKYIIRYPFELTDENIKKIPKELRGRLIQYRGTLYTIYKGKRVSSDLFDSLGTKKMIALAGYLVDAIKNNKVLIIDEIDSSIHFKLTRAIVSLFNNVLNDRAQIIFTTHDINLMDLKTLFRKEQIWFTHKDHNRAYLYSLAGFTAGKDGIRDTSDIIDKYQKGLLGALPEPKLIDALIKIIKK